MTMPYEHKLLKPDKRIACIEYATQNRKVTINQLAEMYGRTVVTVRRWLKEGGCPPRE